MTTSLARIALAFSLVASAGHAALAAGTAPAAPLVPSEVTVFIDLVVEDSKGQPALNLRAEDVVVVQDGVRQKITALVAKERAGIYELRYVPPSGKGGAVQLQVLRQGARARGLNGPALKPRVVMPLSPIEAELAAVAQSRPDAADFLAHVSVMRFESTPEGLHHTLAVEVPFAEIAAGKDPNGFSGRVQILARVVDAGGAIVHRSFVDRSVSAATQQQLLSQRLVWTGQTHLAPGRYRLETIVRDPATSKAAVRRTEFEAPEVAPGMRVSSVALLLPLGSLVVRDQGAEKDDPFLLKGEPIMPTLELKTVAAPGAKVQFFAIVYPDRASAEPVTLRLDLMRDGNIVGSAPISLPPPDERGEIRYAGGLPTRTLTPADYKLRLHAQQGAVVAFEEVPFSVASGDGVKPQLQFGDVAPGARPAGDTGPKARTLPPDSPELADGRRLLKRKQYDLAVPKLKKADKALNGERADVALLLSVAYYRMGAYKDAEQTVRRVIEMSKDDAPMRAEAYTVLGRTLADSEKKLVHKESERLAAALEAFRTVLSISGGESEAGQIALAETLYRLERNDEARAALEALAAKPGVTDSTAERARQLLDSPRCATEACLPPFSFVTLDGKHTTPEDLKGKVVLLSFWATWCGPCVAAMPELKRLHAKYENEPFVMVGVNRDNDKSLVDQFVEKYRVAWPQITDDASDRLAEAVFVRGIPAEIVFDHEGVLVGRTVGWGSETGSALIARIHDAIGRAKKAQRRTVSTK